MKRHRCQQSPYAEHRTSSRTLEALRHKTLMALMRFIEYSASIPGLPLPAEPPVQRCASGKSVACPFTLQIDCRGTRLPGSGENVTHRVLLRLELAPAVAVAGARPGPPGTDVRVHLEKKKEKRPCCCFASCRRGVYTKRSREKRTVFFARYK